MYQLTHCHTLLQPFSQIFLFRIYAPTTYTYLPCLTLISTRPALRFQQIPRAHTAPANQSTNDHRHTLPIPQIPHPRCPTNTHPQTDTRRSLGPPTLTTHSTPSRRSGPFRTPVIRPATSPYFDRPRPHDSTGRVPVIQPVTPLTSFSTRPASGLRKFFCET